MATERARQGTAARRTAWWSVVVLLIAGLGLVAAPSASATGWRTLALRAPSTVVAGVPFDVTVTVLNAAGRPAVAYRGTVRLATDDPLVRTLPGAYTFTRTDRGTHTFTGLALKSGPADIDGYHYRITGLPAGDIKVGAVVPGPYEPDFANDRETLAQADVFTLSPGVTLVQSWEPEDFGPYLDVEPIR